MQLDPFRFATAATVIAASTGGSALASTVSPRFALMGSKSDVNGVSAAIDDVMNTASPSYRGFFPEALALFFTDLNGAGASDLFAATESGEVAPAKIRNHRSSKGQPSALLAGLPTGLHSGVLSMGGSIGGASATTAIWRDFVLTVDPAHSRGGPGVRGGNGGGVLALGISFGEPVNKDVSDVRSEPVPLPSAAVLGAAGLVAVVSPRRRRVTRGL